MLHVFCCLKLEFTWSIGQLQAKNLRLTDTLFYLSLKGYIFVFQHSWHYNNVDTIFLGLIFLSYHIMLNFSSYLMFTLTENLGDIMVSVLL